MKHNEHDAMIALTETAKLRTVDEPDPLEQTQRMTIGQKRWRLREATFQRYLPNDLQEVKP